MAAIDYGVMVWMNGRRVCKDFLYPKIYFENGLMIHCYKQYADIYEVGNTDPLRSFSGAVRCDGGVLQDNHAVSVRFSMNGARFHIKHLGYNVYQMKVSIGMNHYTIIYGYGVDNEIETWNRCKRDYLGRKGAKEIDKAIYKAGRCLYDFF